MNTTATVLAVSLLLACGSSKPSQAPPSPTLAEEFIARLEPDAGWKDEPAVARGTVATHTFHSDALGVDKRYVIYLPAGYADSNERFPVVYLLNGIGGDETNWTEYGRAHEAADRLGLRAIIVMPDGDSSFYANAVGALDYDACVQQGKGIYGMVADRRSFCVRTPRYEDYISKDLLRHVDATYRTIPERSGRALTGQSMGGFGALQLGMRHPDLFASVASHSGVAALLYGGPWPYDAAKAEAALVRDVSTWGAKVEPIGAWVRAIFGPDLANWQAHDPALLATKLAPGALAIYLDAGSADDFGLNAGAEYLHDILTRAGVVHELTIVPGGRHNYKLWSQRIDESLAFHAKVFARPGK